MILNRRNLTRDRRNGIESDFNYLDEDDALRTLNLAHRGIAYFYVVDPSSIIVILILLVIVIDRPFV